MTISGSITSAQMAQFFINNKIQVTVNQKYAYTFVLEPLSDSLRYCSRRRNITTVDRTPRVEDEIGIRNMERSISRNPFISVADDERGHKAATVGISVWANVVELRSASGACIYAFDTRLK